MPKSMRVEDANVVARTNVAAPWDDRTAAESFSAAVLEFSAADLARAARRTKSAAKGWKDATRAPSMASVRNMALSLPSVQRWLAEESGYGHRGAQAMSADMVIRWAHDARAATGLDGDIARAVLRELAPAPEQTPAAATDEPTWNPDNAVYDLFSGRRRA